MARKVRQISDLEIDEISLVDKGANQHAVVTIAKSASGETEENMKIFDEQGNPLAERDLADGDVVFDEAGNAYEFTLDEPEPDEEFEEEEEREPELVGKAKNPFRREPVRKSKPDFAASLREELSKALSDKDRDEVISKAFGTIDVLAEQVSKAQQLAESERAARLQREYTEIAKSYNLPIEDEVLGGVLMRCAENLSYEDCAIISKAFEAAGEALFQEQGYIGGGDNSDVLTQVSALVDQTVSKSEGSREEIVSKLFLENPDLYDEYLSELNN